MKLIQITEPKLEYIKLLCTWRNKNVLAYPTQFKATYKSTRKWLKEQIIDNPNRKLWFVIANKRIIGHAGLKLDFSSNEAE